MPVWLPATAKEEPDVTLTSWGAFEVLIPRIGRPTMHVVGYSNEGGEGRVSSSFTKLNAERGQVISKSGRAYRLEGPPGLHPDADYVWQQWQSTWDVSVLRDLAFELFETIRKAARPT